MATSKATRPRAEYADVLTHPAELSERLDLKSRDRTSLFPWRGQFSPDLIRLLLHDFQGTGAVLDPFAGSGTVLFEALRAGRDCAGTEINPGALIFARLARIACIDVDQRRMLFDDAEDALRSALPAGNQVLDTNYAQTALPANARQIFEASYVLACGNRGSTDARTLVSSFEQVRDRLMSIPYHGNQAEIGAEDARYLPFPDSAFELAITSPPYVNVFNYHQQFRQAVETLGYSPLKVATSEIGSNRKHRQNRLLTVIQYCLDISLSLDELARTVRPGGNIVIVIGRESKVRKLPFDNGALVGSLLCARPDLTIQSRGERKFVTRFGELIYEDLLFVRRSPGPWISGDLALAREVAALALTIALDDQDLDPSVIVDLEQALAERSRISPSPRVQVCDAGLGRCGETLAPSQPALDLN